MLSEAYLSTKGQRMVEKMKKFVCNLFSLSSSRQYSLFRGIIDSTANENFVIKTTQNLFKFLKFSFRCLTNHENLWLAKQEYLNIQLSSTLFANSGLHALITNCYRNASQKHISTENLLLVRIAKRFLLHFLSA